MKNVYYQLLLLQLEEYDLARFLRAVRRTGGISPNRPARKPLVWTAKTKLIYALSVAIFLGLLFYVNSLNINSLLKLAIIVLFVPVHYFLHFIFITISAILLMPFDFIAKELTIARAKSKIRKFKNLKIIGVAGSYGKTGMKEFIATVLEQKYKLLKTGGSVNTPFAIAELILKKLNEDTEVFVVEMGEYYKGDIANICSITPPDISFVTGINEAHLERLKTLDNAASTIFEIAENTKTGGLVFLNGKDKNVTGNYKKYTAGKEVYIYRNKSRGEFDENIPGYIFTVGKSKVFFPLLGEFNLDKIDAVLHLAKKMSLSDLQIITGVKNIKSVVHRLQPIVNRQANTLIIDDSYNGNPDGVEEAIKTLALFKKRRKIYVTPGLVEMGDKTHEIHYNIGRSLAKAADKVILIRDSVTPDIEKGLLDNGFNRKNVIWFEDAAQAYANIKNIMESGDVVLLQNDWPDNYL